MLPPIRSQVEIDAILNRGQHAMASLGLDIAEDSNRGEQLTDVDFRDKVYRLILLRAYLKNLLNPITAELRLYWTDANNEKKLNILLDAVVSLSGIFGGPGIPLVRGRRGGLQFWPSGSGPTSGGPNLSNPGGVTFQNLDVDSPGEVVDSITANGNEFAFYIVTAKGTNSGEGSRLDIIGVTWSGGSQPVVTTYRSDSVNGYTTGVSFSAAVASGVMELTCNVPTDGWIVRGTRIAFNNLDFFNTQSPLPTGGTVGEYMRKTSSTDYDAAFATILMSEISGLSTFLTDLSGGLVAVAGTSYTLLATNLRKVHNFSNVAARSVTVPLANTCAAGVPFKVKDAALTAGTANITLSRSGSDTINGSTSFVMSTNGEYRELYSDGVSKWFIGY